MATKTLITGSLSMVLIIFWLGAHTVMATETPQPQKVVWKNAVGVYASGNNLMKTAPTGLSNAGASSVQILPPAEPGMGYVEFTTNETNTFKMGGLSLADADQGFASIDFGLDAGKDGKIYIFEMGVMKAGGPVGTYVPGDLFRVSLPDGAGVKYYKNGELLYKSTADPLFIIYSPKIFDTWLNDQGATIVNAKMSFSPLTCIPADANSISWKNTNGVSGLSNYLIKTGGTSSAWDAGTSSGQAIFSGDGSVEFSTKENNTWKMGGLSVGDKNQNYQEIKYGLDLGADGAVYIFESGVCKYGNPASPAGCLTKALTTYAAGDKFKIAIEGSVNGAGGVVKYYKNGAVFFTSTVAPTYPLLFDSSFYNSGATVTDVNLSCP